MNRNKTMTELDEIFDDIPRSHSYNTLDSGGLTDTFREGMFVHCCCLFKMLIFVVALFAQL